jgi:pimeloyl-ACP methyl ester carboxylesterase
MRGAFTEGVNLEGLRDCRAQLEKTANLTLYTSTIAMDDLDEVRAALGYNKINLFGGSYGTFAAFVYMRQHPDRVRTAILEGVTPVDAKILLPFAKGVEHSLERMFADCKADKECDGAFPNLRAEFKELTAKIEKNRQRRGIDGSSKNSPSRQSKTRRWARSFGSTVSGK